MTKKQHYLTRSERDKIEAWLQVGMSKSWIARQLGVCRQTIYNEIQRGQYRAIKQINGFQRDVILYSAEKAQQIHKYNQTAKGRPLKIGNDHAFARFLEEKILGVQEDGHIEKRCRCSPAVALAYARKQSFKTRICVSTLYSYIEKGVFLRIGNKDLWEKPKRKVKSKKQNKRIVHIKLPSIENRPQEISLRTRPGDWEMDLIVGAKNTTACLLTLYERYSRRVLIYKLQDRKAACVRSIFDHLEYQLPNFREAFKSITTDNGSEFLEYDLLRRSIRGGSRFEIYYCHSYAAWEKGGNENHNRMIRRWYPKGTDFTEISQQEISQLQDWMNNYPRKLLGWKTPNEIAM